MKTWAIFLAFLVRRKTFDRPKEILFRNV